MNEAIIVLLVVILILLILTLAFQLIYLFAGNEIRMIINKIKFFRNKQQAELDTIMSFINSLASILIKMSNDKIGALIVIENGDSLTKYINVGNKIDSQFFPELVATVFYNKQSPLHDGAMIIRDWRIVSVSSYLPMTKKAVNVKYGARHRAAFGIAEKTDAFAFVVSETSGDITFANMDDFRKLPVAAEKLANELSKIFSKAGLIKKSENLKDIDLVAEVESYNKPKSLIKK